MVLSQKFIYRPNEMNRGRKIDKVVFQFHLVQLEMEVIISRRVCATLSDLSPVFSCVLAVGEIR